MAGSPAPRRGPPPLIRDRPHPSCGHELYPKTEPGGPRCPSRRTIGCRRVPFAPESHAVRGHHSTGDDRGMTRHPITATAVARTVLAAMSAGRAGAAPARATVPVNIDATALSGNQAEQAVAANPTDSNNI